MNIASTAMASFSEYGNGFKIKEKAVRLKSDCFFSCDPPGARTQDPNIKSVVLYQLS